MPPGDVPFSEQRERKLKKKLKVLPIDTMEEKCNKLELLENEIKDECFLAGVTSSQPRVKLVKLFSWRKLPACLKTVIQFYFMEEEGASQHAEL